MDAELVGLLVDLGKDLDEGEAKRLVTRLEAASEPPSEFDLDDWTSAPGVRQALKWVVERWRRTPGLDGRLLAAVLQGSWATTSASRRAERIRLLLTGPATVRSKIRGIDDALRETIAGARERLLLVTYAAYPPEELIENLSEAQSRGVVIELVLETEADSGGGLRVGGIKKLRAIADAGKLYHWPREKRPSNADGKKGSLHAKCLLADDDRLVVSSANLTEHALSLNLELGVEFIGGSRPQTVRRYFDDLVRAGELVTLGSRS